MYRNRNFTWFIRLFRLRINICFFVARKPFVFIRKHCNFQFLDIVIIFEESTTGHRQIYTNKLIRGFLPFEEIYVYLLMFFQMAIYKSCTGESYMLPQNCDQISIKYCIGIADKTETNISAFPNLDLSLAKTVYTLINILHVEYCKCHFCRLNLLYMYT